MTTVTAFNSPKDILKKLYESLAWFEELTHVVDDDDNLKEMPIYKVVDDQMKDDAISHWTQRVVYSYMLRQRRIPRFNRQDSYHMRFYPSSSGEKVEPQKTSTKRFIRFIRRFARLRRMRLSRRWPLIRCV